MELQDLLSQLVPLLWLLLQLLQLLVVVAVEVLVAVVEEDVSTVLLLWYFKANITQMLEIPSLIRF